MQLTLETRTLSTALSRISRIVSPSAKLPILTHLLCDASGDTLRITASDHEQWATVTVPAQVSAPGRFTLPGRDIAELAKRLPDGSELSMSLTAAHVHLTCGRIRPKLDTLDPGMFPDAPVMRGDVTRFVLPPATWLTMHGRVTHAICGDETKRYLCGVYVHHHAGSLRMVATDAKRMAIVDTAAPLGAAALQGVIVPTRAMQSLGTVLAGVEALAAFATDGNLLSVETPGLAYVSRLIDGAYTNYGPIVPPRGEPLRLPTAAFTAVLERAQLFAERSKTTGSVAIGAVVVMDFRPDGVDFTVGTQTSTVYEDTLECITCAADPFRIALSSEQVLDALGQIGTADFEFDVTLPVALNKPLRVSAPGDDTALYLLTPLRVAEMVKAT